MPVTVPLDVVVWFGLSMSVLCRAQSRLLRPDLRESVDDDRLIHTVAGLLASGEWVGLMSQSDSVHNT